MVEKSFSRYEKFKSITQISVFLLVCLILGTEAKKNWYEIKSAIALIPSPSLVISLLFLILALFSSAISWHVSINSFDQKVPIRGTFSIYFVGQIGKYLPGSFWAIVFQMELARQWSIVRTRTFIGSLMAMGIGLLSAAITAIFTVPDLLKATSTYWLVLTFAVIGLPFLSMHVLSQANRLLLSLFKRPNLDASPSQRRIILIYLWATMTWILLGVHLWFLANAFSDPGARGMVYLIGVISLAMVSGQIAFFLPSGIGAREIVLVAGLQGYVGYEVSIAIALISRVMFTISDITLGLIAATYNRGSIKS